MRVTIAYLTSDEVNFQLALGFAEACRASLVRTPPGRDGAPGSCSASLNDLDHLPPERKHALLEGLLSGPPTAPVAVHGYGLDDGQVADLRDHRVLVSPALEPALVRDLCRAARGDEGPIPIAGDPDVGETTDPAELCRLTRAAAFEAHRVMTRTAAASSEELDGLRRRFDHVRSAVDRVRRDHALPLVELGLWLDQLTRKVHDRFPRESS